MSHWSSTFINTGPVVDEPAADPAAVESAVSRAVAVVTAAAVAARLAGDPAPARARATARPRAVARGGAPGPGTPRALMSEARVREAFNNYEMVRARLYGAPPGAADEAAVMGAYVRAASRPGRICPWW